MLGLAQTPARKLAMYPGGEDGSRLLYTSGDLRIAVNNTDGRFTIGTSLGKSLLFGFPNEGATSHAHFFVNDSICGTYLNDGGMHPTSATVTLSPMISAGSIVSRYIVDGIEFTQRLTPTYWGDNPTVLVEYTAVNTTAVAKQVGVLLFLDTMIGDNDYAPIATEYGYFAVEREFISPDIPTYWQAFESSPWQPPDSLIGGGVLVGGSAVPPDRVVFGDFWSMHNVDWNYTLTGEPYSDSAVLFRWDAGPLAPGASRRMATYYGQGSAIISIGDLNLSLSAPDELTIEECVLRTPNPFPINLLVSNATGTTIGGITAEIDIPDACEIVSGEPSGMISPSALSPAGTGTISWQISIDDSLFEHDTTLAFSASVYGTGTDTFTIDWTIDIPGIDGRGPTAELISPSPGGITSCDTVEMFFRLIDIDGIDESSIRVDAGSAFVFWPNPSRLEFDYPYLRCRIPADEIGDSPVEVDLRSIKDNNGCSIRGTYTWNFDIDRNAPETELIEPAPGDTIFDEAFEIVVRLADDNGIAADSLEWDIDGFTVPADLDGGYARISPVDLGIAPTGFEDWRVCLRGIFDNIGGTCGGNEAEPVCVDFYTDFTAPRAEIIEPLPGSYNSCPNPKVEVHFSTPGEDIDPATIRFEYGGHLFNISSPHLTYADSQLTFISPDPAVDGEEITVKLFASTFAGFPIAPLNWTFFSDMSAPEVSAIYPPEGIFITPEDNIILLIRDEFSGLDLDSTIFDIEYTSGTRSISMRHTALIGDGDTLTIDLSELGIDLERCGFVDVRIDARDLAVGCGANTLDDFHYRIDVPCSPPSVGAPDIPEMAYISCETLYIDIPIHDDEGLEVSSMVTRFNGYSIPFGDLVAYTADTLHLRIPRGDGEDSVFIYVSPISDVFGNSAPPLELVYHWDAEPPVFGRPSPSESEIFSVLPEFVSIEVEDNGAGIDISECSITGLDVTVTSAEGLVYDGTNLKAPAVAFGYSGEDSIRFRAVATDAVSHCSANFSQYEWVVHFDQGAPHVELAYPPDGAIIGCENMEFKFAINDSNGVAGESIELVANGSLFTIADDELTFAHDTLSFVAETGLFTHGSTANVAVTAVSDIIGNSITAPIEGEFTFDFAPPEIELVSPETGVIRGPKQLLQWRIHDDIAGLDHSSISISAEGTIFTLADDAVSIDGEFLLFDPVLADMDWNSDIVLSISASDLAFQCPNTADVEVALTYLPAEVEVESTQPAEGQAVSCDPLSVSFILNSEFGIDISNANATIAGTEIASDRITLSGSTVTIEFEEGEVSEGDVEIALISVTDTLGNELAPVALEFRADYSTPVLIDYRPSAGPVSPLGLEIRAVADDAISGVNPLTARFVIDGIEFDLTSDELTVAGDTFVLDASNIGIGGDVAVRFEVADRAELCGANILSFEWNLAISGDGPEFTLVEPFDGSITHDPNQRIALLCRDSDGVDFNTVLLSAGSHVWASTDLILAGDTLIAESNGTWNSGHTYNITISAEDMLGNPSAESVGSFIADFDPPTILGTNPEDGSSLSDVPEFIDIVFDEDITGIDPSSASLVINGLRFESDDPAVSFAQDVLRIDVEQTGLIIQKPDSMEIILESIADYPGDYGPPNAISEEYVFSFIIMEEGCRALPKPFSPNGDGWYDRVTIFTGEPEPTRVRIYTSEGALVVEGGADGKFIWDGNDGTGRPMKPGLYIYSVSRVSDNRTLCGGQIILAR